MAFRVDSGSMRKPQVRADGSLRVDGIISTPGVYKYRRFDAASGKMVDFAELRRPEDVYKPESLATFQMLPVTDNHPIGNGLVNPAMTKNVAIGWTGESIRQDSDGQGVVASMAITDAATIKKVKAGKVELSCGYECDLIHTPGITESGERYDGIQTNIRGNHIALVDRARAGSVARIRMDSADGAFMITDEQRTDEGYSMDELQKAMNLAASEKVRADAAEAKATALETKLATAEGEALNIKAKLTSSEQARTDAADGFQAAVDARVELISAAAPILGSEFVSNGKTAREIKVAVVKRIDSFDVPTDAGDGYVDGRYASAIERAAKSGQALGDLRTAITAPTGTAPVRNDGAEDPEAVSRTAMKDGIANAWKTKMTTNTGTPGTTEGK